MPCCYHDRILLFTHPNKKESLILGPLQKKMMSLLPFDPYMIAGFLKSDVWRFPTKSLPYTQAVAIRVIRIILLCIQQFSDDKCYLRASALTFFSLISIVPVLAMVFGIAQAFGFEQLLEDILYDKFPGQSDVLSQGIEFANNLIEKTRGGALAGVGLIVLIWSVIKVLGNIEASFNDIWEIKKSRVFIRKVTDYVSIVLICPLLFILSNSITIIIKTQIEHIFEKFLFLGFFRPFVFFGFKLTPFILMWFLFTAMYMFMTNTKVKFTSALLAGVVAGTAFQLLQWGLIAFQVGVARYNAIYGSFAAFPLFLFWLQYSWLILLVGAEISFAHQHVAEYEFAPDTEKISKAFRNKLCLYVSYVFLKEFKNGNTPLKAVEISGQTEIPIRLTVKILDILVRSKIINETRDNCSDELVYQPARDIHSYSLKSVLDAINTHGTDKIPLAHTDAYDKLTEAIEKIDDSISTSGGNVKLCDI